MISLKSKWVLLIVIVLLCACGGAVLVNEAYTSAAPDTKKLEAIKTAFLVLGGLGVILATYLNIWQSLESGKQIADKIRFDIGENSYHLIEKFDDPSIGAARLLCRAIHDDKLNYSPAALVKKINDEKNMLKILSCRFSIIGRMFVYQSKMVGLMNRCCATVWPKPLTNTTTHLSRGLILAAPKYQSDLAWLKKQWQ